MIDVPRLRITETEIEAAREQREALNAARGIKGKTTLFSDKVWAALIAEPAVKQWLSDLGALGWRLNGGHDTLPDLEVGEVGIAIKSPVTNARFRGEYAAEVAAQFEDMGEQEILWAGIEMVDPPAVAILGGYPSSRYFAEAKLLQAGDKFKNGVEVRNPVYQMPLWQIDPPLEWLRRLGVRKRVRRGPYRFSCSCFTPADLDRDGRCTRCFGDPHQRERIRWVGWSDQTASV